MLDCQKGMVGRTIEGIPIVGFPEHIDAILSEYAIHGIDIDRVIVAGEPNMLSPVQMGAVTQACERRQIDIDLMPQLLGIGEPLTVTQRRPIQMSETFRLELF